MAIRYFSVSTNGNVAESANDSATLVADITDAIDDAGVANQEVGSNADITTELAAISDALDLLVTSIPTSPLSISINLSQITTKNQLKTLLDSALSAIAQKTNLLA